MTRYHRAMLSRIANVFRCCAVFVLCNASHGAQWQHFDVTRGLPQNSAVAMTVDRYGLLWVGTEDGLARFDGQRFVTFEDAVERGWLPGNYIVALASDEDAVWIAAESGGLARFDLRSERFEPVAIRDPDSDAALNAWSLKVDGDVLWVGTRDRGLFALDRTAPGRILAHWHDAANAERFLPLRSVRDVAVDATGQGHWIAGVGGLARIDRARGAAIAESLDGIDLRQASPDIASVLGRADGSLWLGLRSHGVARRREGEQRFSILRFALTDHEAPVVNRLTETPGGRIVAATDRGLHLYEAGCDCFQPAQSASPLRHVLDDALMLSVVGDDDIVWAGSWNRGLFRFDPQAPDFDLLTPADLGERDAPVAPRSLFVDGQQRLWVGSFGAGARFARVDAKPMAQWRWQRWLGDAGSRDRQVWAFAESADGALFIGSDAGVTRWRDDGRDITHVDLEPEQMDEVRSLFAFSDGALWSSTVGGVYRIDPDTLTTRRFSREQGLDDLRVYALAEWPRGRLVIGTWSGLYTLDASGTRIERLPLQRDGRTYNAGLVWDLHPDAEGGLWIGTSNGLLYLARSDRAEILRYAEEHGLPNNVVYAIEAHGPHELWLSTNRGLARFDRRHHRAVAFDQQDGLQGNEFGFGMAAQDAQGQMYFAGLGGVSRFDPRHVQIAPRAPKAILNRFFLRDRAVVVGEVVNDAIPLPGSLFATGRIALGWRDADLGFAFSALASDPSERLRFQYRLVGKDTAWIDAGDRRYVGYTNLAPGTYAFEVRAADRFDRQGPIRAISIDIAPPFWATWPFRIAAALTVLVLLATLLNWRVAALKRSREHLAREVARQTERIRDQNEQLEAANQALFDRSIRDPLTGAFNRRHFGELAEQAYLGCRARSQPFSLLLFDLDHFKRVNDRHGHAAGDAVLCAVTRTLRPLLAASEALARWGGEEFVVMWPNHDRAAATSRAQAFCDALRALRVPVGEQALQVSASFGLACADDAHQPSLEALIAEADAALYRAKAEGRDRVVVAERPGR